MINILTDSTADLSSDVCKQYGIETIPMYIQIDGNVYQDGTDIHPDELFEAVAKTGVFPTTSAPSPGDFIKFFDREHPSIYIGVSSMLSTTFRNAELAIKVLNHRSVELIDSLSFSTGYGQVVLQAAEWRNEGLAFDEINQRVRQLIKKTRGIFILDTLDYLYHGGRCSRIDHFFSSVLKIRPFLNMLPDGTLGVLQKVRGSRQKAVRALWNYFKAQMEKYRIRRIFISHLDCEEEAEFLKEQIFTYDHAIEIKTAIVGCALATHSGPKPLGIAYSVE